VKARSLQDLAALKKAMADQRAQAEAERQRQLELQRQAQAEREVFVRAIGPVQEIGRASCRERV